MWQAWFQVVLVVKILLAKTGDSGSIPGSGRSPGGGYGNPFLPGDPMDSGAWRAMAHSVAKSRT